MDSAYPIPNRLEIQKCRFSTSITALNLHASRLLLYIFTIRPVEIFILPFSSLLFKLPCMHSQESNMTSMGHANCNL